METDYRHNGSIMDQGLTRPQMGHATAGAWKCFTWSRICVLRIRRGRWTQLDFTRRSLEMCGQNLLVCLVWVRLPSASPTAGLCPLMVTDAGLHVTRKHSVNASVCSVLKRLLPKALVHYECCGGCFSKRRKSLRSSVRVFYAIRSPGR